MADNQHRQDASDSGKRTETKAERTERKAEDQERKEVAGAIQSYTDKDKASKNEQKVSGRSKATGAGADAYGRGGLASAKDLLGDLAHETLTKDKPNSTMTPERRAQVMADIERDGYIMGKPKQDHAPNGSAEDTGTVTDYKPQKNSEHSYSLGMNYQNSQQDSKDLGEKFSDFATAAARRATDPQGWQTWYNGELEKIGGIAEGLSEAKEETKAAVAAGFTALTDGTVTTFLAKPNAINEPLFKTVGNVFDAVRSDPNATNKALEALGNAVVQASNEYSALPNHDKGKVIGKTMFTMVNPEGSTEGAEVAIKVADKVATQVDKAVMDTIAVSMKAAERAAGQSPELMQQAKQRLLDYLNSKGLLGQKLEYAGIPDGYFDGMQPTKSAAKDNYMAMSQHNEDSALPRRSELEGERSSVPERATDRFVTSLRETIEGLSEHEKNFLAEHRIEIKPVKRITDVPETDQHLGGCYKQRDRAIYIPEELFHRGAWTKHNDVAFVLRHEFGHAFNANKGRFGEYLSNDKRFARVFTEDFNKIPEHVKDTLLLSEKFKPIELARDEVFADMYAHASGLESNNRYSQLMKQYFPSCLKYLEAMPKW